MGGGDGRGGLGVFLLEFGGFEEELDSGNGDGMTV